MKWTAVVRHWAVIAMFAFTIATATTAASAASPSLDPRALDAVRRYVAALRRPDIATAYALLTPAQQRYFGNARNYASNYTAAQYRVVSFVLKRTTVRNPHLVQIDVAQRVTYFDIANETAGSFDFVEPYFAIFGSGGWGVKEVFVPWKSYAPRASGKDGGLIVIVDRIEFFDKHIRVYCTLRNLGTKPTQVLPLLQTTLKMGSGTAYAAQRGANFPFNDRQFYDGVRIYPNHQVVGYINFTVPTKVDESTSATLTLAPAIEDGALRPGTVTVGPMQLPKL